MAFQHATLFYTAIALCFLVAIAIAQARRDSSYSDPKMTRGFDPSKLAESNLSGARAFGKRANIRQANNLLLEWMAVETRRKHLGMLQNLLHNKDQKDILSDWDNKVVDNF